ncbi:hypothetical protein ABBQ32_012190 [Trebouxia sp. C0010 RCD-2024]
MSASPPGISGFFDDLPFTAKCVLVPSAFLVACSILRLITNCLPSQRPPVFEGIPFIGGLLKFVQGPNKLLDRGYKKHGEVFTVPVLNKNITFLIGTDVTPFFFKATDEEMSQQEVYQFNVPTFGKGVVFDVDSKIRAEQFKFFASALQSSKLKSYIPLFAKESEDYFAAWPQEGTVDLFQKIAELIIMTASRTLMGREVREQLFSQVTSLFHDLDMGMLPVSVLLPYLPIPAHNRRDRARAELAKIFAKIIATRRATGSKEDDMLQVFIDSKYRLAYNGRYTTDEEITGMLIAVLFAGQHTSSVTSTWTLLSMLANKEVGLQPALAEQQRVVQEFGSEITQEALNHMQALQRNITEALRINPPLTLLLRQVKKSFAVTTSSGKTYVVPKGHIAAASPTFGHALPSVFPEPSKFNPDRFMQDPNIKKPFSFIGFGGGRHGCMGTNFAYLQIKTILSIMLRNFEMELVDPFPEADYTSMVVGPKPCRIHFRRRQLVPQG